MDSVSRNPLSIIGAAFNNRLLFGGLAGETETTHGGLNPLHHPAQENVELLLLDAHRLLDENPRTGPVRFQSAALSLTQGSASLVVEGTLGTGSANGNAVGVNIQPSYFFTRRVQLVGRYQVAGGTETDTLTAQRRYEREVGLRTGDLYNAVYAGLNLHLAEHRVKLMTGVEYARLSGRHAVTGSVALRRFWGPHSRGPFPMAQVLGR